MTHKILNRDTEDEILEAFRLSDNHATGTGTIGYEEFYKIMTHKIINRDTVTRDSFLHFFRNCPVTARLLEVWSSLFEPIQQINSPSFQALYWYGVCPGNIADNGYTLLVVDSFKYVLWKFKKRKKIPNLISFNREYFFTLSNISNMSKKVRLGISNSNFLTNFLPGLG